MGAIEMGLTEEELPELVSAWRQSNPQIVRFWWDVDRAVKMAIKTSVSAPTAAVCSGGTSTPITRTGLPKRNAPAPCAVRPF
ncbi:MAG: hypothetical protein Q4B72_13340 [Lachnospiraceae bacterium]|nr:hypothetical protein [Lachnospiraceae bacterium]